ncbi:MAG: rhomboid family intramembrane serine protease [Planctomycetota bacterium]|nr:rhomboid family intramembrane serine protease [Planctomycetota bacterium]
MPMLIVPIGVEHKTIRTAYVTYAIIAFNTAVLVYCTALPQAQAEAFIAAWEAPGSRFDPLLAITSGFLHAGWTHLIGNMVVFWAFARVLEEKLGHVRMAFAYLILLFFSKLALQRLTLVSYSGSLGASGAVMGMLGLFWFTFSKTRAKIFYWFLFPNVGFVWFPLLAACLLASDLVHLYLEHELHVSTGIGSLAHLGGFAAGLVLGGLWRIAAVTRVPEEDMATRLWNWLRDPFGRKARARLEAQPDRAMDRIKNPRIQRARAALLAQRARKSREANSA